MAAGLTAKLKPINTSWKHFPGCAITPEVAHTIKEDTYRWIPSTNWHVASRVITEERVKWAITSMAHL